MHNETYYRSKVPLPLVLLFLVNLFLVCAVELLLFYRTPLPLTGDALAQYDSSFEGCTILQEHKVNRLWCHLVETEDGRLRIVPAASHGLFSSRGRIYEDQIVSIPENITETTYSIKIGIRTSTVTVSPDPLPYMENQGPAEVYMAISYAASGGIQGIAAVYMAIAALLEFLELALWHILTRS